MAGLTLTARGRDAVGIAGFSNILGFKRPGMTRADLGLGASRFAICAALAGAAPRFALPIAFSRAGSPGDAMAASALVAMFTAGAEAGADAGVAGGAGEGAGT